MLRPPNRNGLRNCASPQGNPRPTYITSMGSVRPLRLRSWIAHLPLSLIVGTVLISIGTYMTVAWMLTPTSNGQYTTFQGSTLDEYGPDYVEPEYEHVNPVQWVGKKVEVLWQRNQEWFPATVTHYDREHDMHLVQYDDGAVERLNLNNEASVRLVYGAEWIGKVIEVLYDDGEWYQASVVAMTPKGQHVLHYNFDNSKATIALNSVSIRVPKWLNQGDDEEVTIEPETSTQKPMLANSGVFGVGEALVGEKIILPPAQDSNEWIRTVIIAYNHTSDKYLVRYKNGPHIGVKAHISLDNVAFKMYFGKDNVGDKIRIFWAEYNNWYNAVVEDYHEENGTHTVRYVDDKSTEVLRLSDQRLVKTYDAALVGKIIRILDGDALEWYYGIKVVHYNADQETHVLVDLDGNAKAVALEYYTFKVMGEFKGISK